MSVVWSLAGLNKTKPLREVTRTHPLRDLTHSGGRWRNRCNARRGGRWTIGRRAFFRLLFDRVRRSQGKCLSSSKGVHRTLARWAAVTHSFVDPSCWMGRTMRRKRRDLYTVYSWFHLRRTCTFEVACGEGTRREKRRRLVRLQVGSRHLRRAVNDKLSFRPQNSLTCKDLLAGSPLSKSVGPCPLQKPCSLVSKIKRSNAARSSHFAGSRCLEQSQLVSLESLFAHSHPKPMRLPAYLLTPGQVQKRTTTERKVRCKSRNGVK